MIQAPPNTPLYLSFRMKDVGGVGGPSQRGVISLSGAGSSAVVWPGVEGGDGEGRGWRGGPTAAMAIFAHHLFEGGGAVREGKVFLLVVLLGLEESAHLLIPGPAGLCPLVGALGRPSSLSSGVKGPSLGLVLLLVLPPGLSVSFFFHGTHAPLKLR